MLAFPDDTAAAKAVQAAEDQQGRFGQASRSGLSIIHECDSDCPRCGRRLSFRQTWFLSCTFVPIAYNVWECNWCDEYVSAVPVRKKPVAMAREES